MLTSGTQHLLVRQSGHVVSIWGWINNLTIPANTPLELCTISNVSLPADVVRTRGVVGTNAYTTGNDAYIGLQAGGKMYIYTSTANMNTLYFNMTYIR